METEDDSAEYGQILLTGELASIRRASTQSTHRLELFSRLINTRNLHKFCADVDMFLIESGIDQHGVHYNLDSASVQEIVNWLLKLGLWEAYVLGKPMPACLEELHRQTLPTLVREETRYDGEDCHYCCTKYNFKAGKR